MRPILLAAAFIASFTATSRSQANVVGGDLQNFNAVPGGVDFVTVHSSETLEPGYLNLGLMINYAVNSLPYFEADTQSRLESKDSLTMADVGVGVGIYPNVEIGFAAQDLLNQSNENANGGYGEFTSRGIINYRAYGKVHVFGDDRGGVALVGSGVFNRVRNNPYTGVDGSPVGIFEIAADTSLDEIALALNLGYRFREKGGPIPGMNLKPIGNQIIASAALSYLLPAVDTKLIVEMFGSRPANRENTGLEKRQASSAEVLVGVKYDVTSNAALHAGAGTELINGASSPDWRVYAGVNWAIGPAFDPSPAPPAPKTDSPAAPMQKAEERSVFNVNFDTGSDRVPPDAVAELEKIAREVKSGAYTKIVIEGHTDSVGSEESNQKLSQRRAETVRKWLIDNAGIDSGKIEAVGYGEAQPVADNGNFQGRARNRRVEVVVTR